MPLSQLCQISVKRARELFAANEGLRAPPFPPAVEISVRLKLGDEYSFANKHSPAAAPAAAAADDDDKAAHQITGTGQQSMISDGDKRLALQDAADAAVAATTSAVPAETATTAATGGATAATGGAAVVPAGASLSELIHALSPYAGSTNEAAAAAAGVAAGSAAAAAAEGAGGDAPRSSLVSVGSSSGGELGGLTLKRVLEPLKPQWHPPWMLQRVISGHLGWVNCVSVDPTNTFFATGSNDRLLKIWDLATGHLKLSLTGRRPLSASFLCINVYEGGLLLYFLMR